MLLHRYDSGWSVLQRYDAVITALSVRLAWTIAVENSQQTDPDIPARALQDVTRLEFQLKSLTNFTGKVRVISCYFFIFFLPALVPQTKRIRFGGFASARSICFPR